MIPRILPPSLWTLQWLMIRARIRRIGRGCRTVRGAVGLLAGLLIFGLWIGSFFIQQSRTQPNPDLVRDYLPVGLLVMCVMNLFFSKTGEGIAFRAAEVEFLFPGPFRRRELLLYRIVGNCIALVPAGLMISVFVSPYVTLWLAGFVGGYFALQFITLFQILIGLLAGSVRARLFSRARVAVAVLLLLALAASLLMSIDGSLPDSAEWGAQLRHGWPARIALLPFDVFGNTIAAERWSRLLVWGGAAGGINLLLTGFVLWLDLDYREAALRTSQRIYQRLQSARSGRLHWPGQVKVGRLRYLTLPRLYGAGPVASYQTITALRSARGLILFMLFMVVVTGLPMVLVSRSTGEDFHPSLAIPGMIFVLILFPQFLQFDFRGEVDRMDLLKTLPLRPTAIVCGQLLAPTVFLLVIELILVAVIALTGALGIGSLLIALPFLPLVTLMVIALENLVWLLFPYRMPVAGSADLQTMIRHSLTMMLKLLCLFLMFGVSAAIGGITWLVTDSEPAACVAAWCASAASCAGILPVMGWAFQRFDPAADTPA